MAIPKLRTGWRHLRLAGDYFPHWLPPRRKRAERALTTVVATGGTCGLRGTSPTAAP